MSKVYDEFLVYDLENTGEKKKLDINQDELQNHLNPEQVLIIIREDLRRIFIWKGSKSPVRKRFISSRVAQELQKNLQHDARYHRCKIVSIDQGDELQEFLNAFKLESMEVKETLPDMRYIRNIERDRMKEAEEGPQKTALIQVDEDYYSPGFDNREGEVIMSSFSSQNLLNRISTVGVKQKKALSVNDIQKALDFSKEEKDHIKEKILTQEIPDNYERQNLILGYTLYGAVSKTTEVFGKNVADTVWEEVKKFPKGMLELDDNKLRVYFNEDKGIVEAIEVLKLKTDQSKPSQPSKKAPPRRTLPKIPSDKD
jgi:hypothetical protein